METYSSNSTNLLNGLIDDEHPRFEIIMQCKNMMVKIPYVVVNYVPKNCNTCVDILSKMGYTSNQNDVI